VPTGYEEFKTYRKWMALMGDWRHNKDEEIDLDGIGGVNILVKADVHRSGRLHVTLRKSGILTYRCLRHQLSLLRIREPS